MSSDPASPPLVGVIMGSQSDWAVLKSTATTLEDLEVPFEAKIISAHRTPKRMAEYAETARSRGIKVIIASAGGAAHLPGMVAAQTTLPVLGVPGETKTLKGMDSLLSIVQMPRGIPVGTLAIGEWGAVNAAIFAASILSTHDAEIAERLAIWRQRQSESVPLEPTDMPSDA